eukprot:439704_1
MKDKLITPEPPQIYYGGVLEIAKYIIKFHELNDVKDTYSKKIMEWYFNKLWYDNKELETDEQFAVLMTYVIFTSINALREICYYIKGKTGVDPWYSFPFAAWSHRQDHEFNKIPDDWKSCIRNLLQTASRWDDSKIDNYISTNRYFRNYDNSKLTQLLWLIGNFIQHYNDISPRNPSPFKCLYDMLQDKCLSFLPYLLHVLSVFLEKDDFGSRCYRPENVYQMNTRQSFPYQMNTVETTILDHGIYGVWILIKGSLFTFLSTLKDSKIINGNELVVGSRIKLKHNNGTEQTIQILEISDATHSLCYCVIGNNQIHRIQLKSVTSTNQTFIEWANDCNLDMKYALHDLGTYLTAFAENIKERMNLLKR